MLKRKKQNSDELTPAAKIMADKLNTDNILPPEQRIFRYQQTQINVAPWYLAPKLADVNFVFDSFYGNITHVPAHKNLLAAASDVFEKMFFGEQKAYGDITIVDASEAAFKEFLQFFYLNDVKLTAKHVVNVLYLGDKYNVKNCVDACVEFLTKELSNENACTALSHAIFYEQKELMKACEKQILLNTDDILKSAGFLECSKKALAYILKMNLLSCSEVDVFEACMAWVRAKSQQQVLSKAMVEEHLGGLYSQIRFASMTSKEFCALQTKYNAVLSSDFEAIVRLIEREDNHSEHFNTSPRQVKWNDATIQLGFANNNLSISWQALDYTEKGIFSASEPLLLGGFKCNDIHFGKSARDLESDLLIDVKITEARALDNANARVLSSMTANLGSDLGAVIALPHPILIRPNFYYTICAKGFPKGHFYQSSEQKPSVTHKCGIKIDFHNDKVDDGKIVRLVWKLIFNKV